MNTNLPPSSPFIRRHFRDSFRRCYFFLGLLLGVVLASCTSSVSTGDGAPLAPPSFVDCPDPANPIEITLSEDLGNAIDLAASSEVSGLIRATNSDGNALLLTFDDPTVPIGTNSTITAAVSGDPTVTCRFSVSVTSVVPFFSACPAGELISIELPPGSQEDFVTLGARDEVTSGLAAQDATGVDLSIDNNGITFEPSTVEVSSTVTVTATATDPNDGTLTVTCRFSVQVITEGANRFTNCPLNLMGMITTFSETDTSVSWPVPTARTSQGTPADVGTPVAMHDGETISIDTSSSSDHSGDFPEGTTTITYTSGVREEEGTCMFVVTVTNNIPPPFFSSCPEGETLQIMSDSAVTITASSEITDQITAVEADGSTSLTPTYDPLMVDVGSTVTVTATVTETETSLTATCRFSVSVTTPGGNSFTSCPTDVEETIDDPTRSPFRVEWSPPVAASTANPATPVTVSTPTASPEDGSTLSIERGVTVHRADFRIGMTTITYTAGTGDMEVTCDFTVNILVRPLPSGSSFYLAANDAPPAPGNPFLIITEEDIRTLASLVNDEEDYTNINGSNTGAYAEGNYRLLQDINFIPGDTVAEGGVLTDSPPHETSNFTPIGNLSNNPFSGTFDGANNTIRGLRYSYTNNDAKGRNIGLFGILHNAHISNITLADAHITGFSNVGALVGLSTINPLATTGDVSPNRTDRASITNAHTEGNSFITARHNQVGGLVGGLFDATLEDSSSVGNVDAFDGIAGGLVGNFGSSENLFTPSLTYSAGLSAFIRNSSSSASVRAMRSRIGESNGTNAGGLIGNMSFAMLTDSYATGSVTADTTNAGGLVGGLTDRGIISNSYATGNVDGAVQIGGLVGIITNASLIDVYATGNVTATQGQIGGLVGIYGIIKSGEPGEIRNAYTTGNVTAPATVGGIVGDLLGVRGTPLIINASASGRIVARGGGNTNAGGIVGSTSNGNLINVFFSGRVEGDGMVGGIAGGFTNSQITNAAVSGTTELNLGTGSDVGGIVGFLTGASSQRSTIRNTIAWGIIRLPGGSPSNVGGLVGRAQDASTITNSFWNTDRRTTSAVGPNMQNNYLGLTGDDLEVGGGDGSIYAEWNSVPVPVLDADGSVMTVGLDVDGDGQVDTSWMFENGEYPRLLFPRRDSDNAGFVIPQDHNP